MTAVEDRTGSSERVVLKQQDGQNAGLIRRGHLPVPCSRTHDLPVPPFPGGMGQKRGSRGRKSRDLGAFADRGPQKKKTERMRVACT